MLTKLKQLIITLRSKFFQVGWSKRKTLLAILLFSVFLILVVVSPALAGLNEAAFNMLALVVAAILMIFIYIIGGFIMVVFYVLLWIAEYNNFIYSGTVMIGWVVVRDVVNMFFVLIFLVIAFATILKVESYSYKRLLPKMIILAILVNFSKTICGLAIDFSQVIMLTFVNAFKDVGPGNFINATGIPSILDFPQVWYQSTFETVSTDITASSIAGSYFLALIYMTFLLIILIIMVVILAFRVIYLWFLIVLSPIFFLLLSFPSGMTYARQWSQQFVKYLIVGPVLAFFIWLSLAVFGNLDADLGAAVAPVQKGGSPPAEPHAGATEAGSWSYMARFIIAIGMLIAGMSMTGQLSVAGGKLGTAALGKMQALGGKAAMLPLKRGGMLLERALGASKATSWLTPTFWKGFGGRGERLREESRTRVQYAGEKASERLWKSKKAAANLEEQADRKIINERMDRLYKEVAGTGGKPDKEKMMALALRSFHDKSSEGALNRRVAMEMFTKEGNFDDVQMHFVQSGMINEENWQEWGFDDKEQIYKGDNETAKIFASHFIGLDRDKYDPAKILDNLKAASSEELRAIQEKTMAEGLRQYLPEDVLADKRKATEEEKITAIDSYLEDSDVILKGKIEAGEVITENDRQGAETRFLDQALFQEARRVRDDNVTKSSTKDQDKLRTLGVVSRVGREVGHWEQVMGMRRPEDEKFYIMDQEEVMAEVSGEAAKREVTSLRNKIAPHVFVPRVFNKESGKWEVDWQGQMSDFQEQMFRDMFRGAWLRDLHRIQPRVLDQILRTRQAAGEENKWMDDHGNFVNEKTYQRFQNLSAINDVGTQAIYQAKFYGRSGSGVAPKTGESLASFKERKRKEDESKHPELVGTVEEHVEVETKPVEFEAHVGDVMQRQGDLSMMNDLHDQLKSLTSMADKVTSDTKFNEIIDKLRNAERNIKTEFKRDFQQEIRNLQRASQRERWDQLRIFFNRFKMRR